MPNSDGGHYFLTALIPLKTGAIEDDPGVFTSPVHALRKLLAQLPPSPTLRFRTEPSPFARVPGLHFARLVIVDDVAYNGRVGEDAIVGRIQAALGMRSANPLVPQAQDHLPRPYLLLAMDFDAPDGRDPSRDDFLRGMWDVLSEDIGKVLRYAIGFDKVRQDRNGFATYIAECQIETTMSFNDYYIGPTSLPDWTSNLPGKATKIAALVGAVALAIAVVDFLLGFGWPHLRAYGWVFLLLGLLIIAGATGLAFFTITRQGEQAFPTDPRTTLPNVLKALHLQRAFAAFVIENQRSIGDTSALHAAFGRFLATQKPEQRAPTQDPGTLGI